jgi:Transposase DDE domain
VTADLDTLLTALYVFADELLPRWPRARRNPRITDSELACLAVAQVLLDIPSERRFLCFANTHLSHLFGYLPKQPGYNKRMRALAPQIVRLLNAIAFASPSWCDSIRLLDSTPVPVGASRETVKRSEFAGHAAYGYCASHSRYFWGFRLYLLCAADGMPIAFELAPANTPEREVAAEMLARVELEGYTVIADKGFAGADFEALMGELGAVFLRPDRKGEKPRFGKLGGVRQWVESIIDTTQGTALPGAPRRPHNARPLHPRRPASARPRHRDLAQLAALGGRRNRHRRPQPHRLRPLSWCSQRNQSSSVPTQ